MNRAWLQLCWLWIAVLLAACSTGASNGRSAGATSFDASQLAKTDIDRVAEAHQREIRASLQVLAEKLYRRNPREWRKSGEAGIEAAVARVFSAVPPWNLPELGGRRGTGALALAFREDYRGDRVAALIAGLGSMIQRAFNDKSEFFILDDLDPQMLHNSARNVEIAAWKLAHDQDSRGSAFLLSNELGPAGRNLSFEREFGRIIGNLDLLSRIIADKANRSIVRVMQSLATAVFLPVPMR